MDIEKICKNNERETKQSSDLTFRLAEEHLMENPAYNKNKTVYQFYIKNCLQGARGSFFNIQFTLAIELSNQNSFSSHLSQISSFHFLPHRATLQFPRKIISQNVFAISMQFFYLISINTFFPFSVFVKSFQICVYACERISAREFSCHSFLLLVKEQKCLVFFIEVFTL